MAELRPMRVGEILDAGLAVYRRHFGLLLQVGLVALWLPVAANVYVQVGGGQLAHPVLYIFANVLQYFGSLVLTASAVRIISDSYLGRAPQLGDAVTFAMSKVWPLFDIAKRSEEHTSELQSRLHLVCRLLLEKKKKNKQITHMTTSTLR